jgi:hypothetical protein
VGVKREFTRREFLLLSLSRTRTQDELNSLSVTFIRINFDHSSFSMIVRKFFLDHSNLTHSSQNTFKLPYLKKCIYLFLHSGDAK